MKAQEEGETRSLKPVRCVESGDTACAYKQPGGLSEHNKAALRRLSAALGLSASFMLAEFVLGFFANSVALMTDAAHLLTDVGAFAIGILSIRLASTSGNEQRSFGLHRAQVLGSLAAVVLNWVAVIVLVIEAIKRLVSPPSDVDGRLILLTASVGIGLNFLLLLVLGNEHSHHGHAHSHGHDHVSPHERSHSLHAEHPSAHEYSESRARRDGQHSSSSPDRRRPLQVLRDYTCILCFGGEIGINSSSGDQDTTHGHQQQHEHDIESGECEQHTQGAHRRDKRGGNRTKHKDMNVRSAAVHVLGDQVQSIGVVIAGGLIWYKDSQNDDENWYFIDPIATFMFSILVIMTTIPLAKETLKTLMEEVPAEFEYKEIKERLGQIEGVLDVHDLHIWSLSNGKPILTAHLDVRDDQQPTEVLHVAQDFCSNAMGISHSTIQVEQRRG